MHFKKTALTLGLAAALCSGAVWADEGEGHAIPRLDHVFVIVMENQIYGHIYGNPDAPFINGLATTANLATNYYGVGHPSLTNYLEIVGGSNFGIENDNSPAWHSNCKSSLEAGVPALGNSSLLACPIKGSGTDAATLAQDPNQSSNIVYNIPIPAAPAVAQTIADQLVAAGLSYKSYQESLPPYGADGVNISDGLLSDVTGGFPSTTSPGAPSGTPHLYAVKHNPFVYFANVQAGTDPRNSLANSVGFERLYADLSSGHVPNYSFIVPNQCHDQHGRGSGEVGPYCQTTPDHDLILSGDQAVESIVGAIKASRAWDEGKNAIVVVWDENDYSVNANQVVAIVDTNYGVHGTTSNVAYNHFSLLKTIEAGFGLPCLNHACDSNVDVMSDLFAR